MAIRRTRAIGQGLRPMTRGAGLASSAILLDTNAIIRAQLDRRLAEDARGAIEAAQAEGGILISVVSAWEMALLARNHQSPTGRLFNPDVETWFANVMRAPGVAAAPMTFEIAMAAWRLPEPLHRDPADRLLIATARTLDIPLVTRDRAILDYAALGHVRAVAC